jgi:hypothetical protein
LVPESGEILDDDFRMDQSDSDGTFALREILPGKYLLMTSLSPLSVRGACPDSIGALNSCFLSALLIFSKNNLQNCNR